MRNWLGNGNGSVTAGATAVAETQLVSGLMAELAKEKSERYADNVGINTFKAARTAGPAVPDPNAPTTSTVNA